MASSTRSNRRSAGSTTSSQPDVSSLSNVERLLLAQAVYEFGANAWPHVSKLLSKHPLLSRPKAFFNAQACHTIYDHLMQAADLEITDSCNTPRNASNLLLAQRHYQARVLELKDLILAEEDKFKRVVTEIEEIRGGLWDDKIKSKITGVPIEAPVKDASEPPHSPTTDAVIPDVVAVDESSSDLTGVDSDEVAKQDQTVSGELDGGQPESTEKIDEEIPAAATPESDIAPDDEQPDPPAEAASSLHHENDAVSSPEDLEPAEQEPEEPGEPDRRSETKDEPSPAKSAEDNEENPAEPDSDGSVMDLDEEEEEEGEEVDTPAQTPPISSRRRESKRKASEVESAHDQREKKKAREESEPMDEDDPGPSPGPSRRRRERNDEQVAIKRFQNVIGMLHSQISQHRNGNIFHNPIKDSEAPDYREIVKRPMDLKTIKTRIKDGVITNSLEFQRDVLLMFANAMMYNRPDSDIYTMAEEMMLESEEHISAHRQTEGLIGKHSRPTR